MTARTPTRTKAYEAIDSERDYQDDKFSGKSHSAIDRTLDEFILYIKQYADEAGALTTHENPEEALHFVRKVAALCVGCMEAHGAPMRVTAKSMFPAPLSDLHERILTAIRIRHPALDGTDEKIFRAASSMRDVGLFISVGISEDKRLIASLTDTGKRLADQILKDRADG